jgi:radical SAM superfamily enzyme YgiQ (UPF0313 family)
MVQSSKKEVSFMNSKGSFLFLTDNTSYKIREPRYLGPYRVADELERAGFHTVVIDKLYSFPNFFDYLEKLLDESFLGVGLSTTFLTPPGFNDTAVRYKNRDKRFKSYYDYGVISADLSERKEWFRRLRNIMTKRAPKAKLFVGGSKAQFFYHNLYEDLTEIDFIVMGAVDFVFPEIAADISAGRELKLRIMGNKKVVDTMSHYRQPKINPRHQWRSHWAIQKGEVLPIEIGRGCAFNCKFCNYEKKSEQRKSTEDLRSELIFNFEQFGTQYYQFVDDCFNDSRKKVEEIGNMILGLPFKIEWASYLRFDVAVKFPETADLIVAAGGRAFHWGVESLTPEVARRAGKGTHSELIKEFMVSFAKKHKGLCYSTGSFIVGLPGETEETWRQQLEWLVNYSHFDFLLAGPLGIAPYKPEFDGSVIDYAEYSRNPAKYGFFEYNEQNGFWKHETMDQKQAASLANETMEAWEKKCESRRGISTDIWIYPVLRSLGFDTTEVQKLYFDTSTDIQKKLYEIGRKRIEERRNSYYAEMRELLNSKNIISEQKLNQEIK